ncbi:hypothetical protein [Actinomadura rugatobispora]|uniref:Uncharacterized protein n=1 Tax=Actinomadura rugatobispora TaxID=1994 RepID=A0ABW1AFS5_9ACTN|nr:hypothetical protein GCM10010200_072420 [Actinomadura rugatobispora]
MDAELRQAVDERLAERLESARRRRERREAERAERAERRAAGLRARHATKLARINDKEKTMPNARTPDDIAAHIAKRYLAHVSVSPDGEFGEHLAPEAITAALANVQEVAAGLDGPVPCWEHVPFLDDNGEEKWILLDHADADRLNEALMYAAAELAALVAEMNNTASRAVGLIRLIKAKQTT